MKNVIVNIKGDFWMIVLTSLKEIIKPKIECIHKFSSLHFYFLVKKKFVQTTLQSSLANLVS